ncbi:hypothetical protein K7432_004311 [Basidiobolus ranarum]|uniref:C2H2-type domain-containing protein n=1 Tax=Basidiobolus ranarum TaxID=34480 RepID=A0ABR2WYE9_9FUNG
MRKSSPERSTSGQLKSKQKETTLNPYPYPREENDSFSRNSQSSKSASEPSVLPNYLYTLTNNRAPNESTINTTSYEPKDNLDLYQANNIVTPPSSKETNRIFVSPIEPKVYVGPSKDWERLVSRSQFNPLTPAIISPKPSTDISQQNERSGFQTANQKTHETIPLDTRESSYCTILKQEASQILESEPTKHNLIDKKEVVDPTTNKKIYTLNSSNSGEPSSKAITKGNSPALLEAEVDGKKHICEECSRSFSRPSALKTHMYTHTGEKPFTCSYHECDKRFSVESNLRRHYRLHLSQERHLNERSSRGPYHPNGNPRTGQPGFYPHS